MMVAPSGEHTFRDFQVVDDCLCVGGETLVALAERVGTPFYAYARAAIDARLATLRAAMPPIIRIHYAVKANPMPALVAHLAPRVDGFDVASLGELDTVLRSAADPRHIGFAGPGKTSDELIRAVAAGVVVHMESENEMARIATIARTRGVRASVTIRVNPDFRLEGAGMRMAGTSTPFGVDAERVPGMLRDLAALDSLDFVGFHFFMGSQNLRARAIQETHARVLELASELASHTPARVRLLNLGGGFGIPYFPGDAPLELEPIGANVARLLPTVQRRFPDAAVVLELGRYLVGEAGIYVCRVVDRKVSRGRVFLITNGGLHHHLAASGNFGQFIRRNYPVAVGTKVFATGSETVTVVGALCTPLDLLADRVELPVADVGDLIVVFQSGAYGLTASPTAFLSRPPPVEVLV